MNNYTLTYSFKKVADNVYAVTYNCVDQNNMVILAEREWLYKPLKRKFETNNEVRNALNALFGARKCTTWKLDGQMKIICTNPESDFLSKSEMYRRTIEKRQREALAAIRANEQPVVQASSSDALYEVVNKNGVWTIVKHAEPLYTAEQAKTVLFQKIVNG